MFLTLKTSYFFLSAESARNVRVECCSDESKDGVQMDRWEASGRRHTYRVSHVDSARQNEQKRSHSILHVVASFLRYIFLSLKRPWKSMVLEGFGTTTYSIQHPSDRHVMIFFSSPKQKQKFFPIFFFLHLKRTCQSTCTWSLVESVMLFVGSYLLVSSAISTSEPASLAVTYTVPPCPAPHNLPPPPPALQSDQTSLSHLKQLRKMR